MFSFYSDFEHLATEVLNECHHKDPDKAMMLAERKSPCWNEMTCLQIAAAAIDQKFLSSVACQESMNVIWKHGIIISIFKVSEVFLSRYKPLLFAQKSRPLGYKTSFVLNSTEHEISTAHRETKIKNFLVFKLSDVVFIMLINAKRQQLLAF